MNRLDSDQDQSPFGLVVASPGSAVPPIWTDWLLFMVPLFTTEMRDLTNAELARLRTEAADLIAGHGDDAQYGGQHRAGARTAIARALALLAWAEGGVTALGIHACVRPHTGCPGRFDATPCTAPEEGSD
ncbi:hypothetical protein [Streptomyces sp. NPDC047525]|uniref:hypothetical protein n=1 Tax=Streptomyces sp. NPDC047525 TaxID=3155264 RepID=UPI00340BD166